MPPALTDFDIPSLQQWLQSQSMPLRHAQKLLRRFYNTGGQSIDGIEIPRRLAQMLGHDLLLRQSRILTRQQAADGTLKLLVAFPCTNAQDSLTTNYQLPTTTPSAASVECVLMPSHRPDRAAGCISSQVGCAMGCDFCASTVAGLQRDLTAGEIVEQFLHLRAAALNLNRRLVTLVFMGMGEPLLNYDNVAAAIRRIAGPELGALGWRQITVSTVGIIPGIQRLAEDNLGVLLALSLHAPDDDTRAAIVPTGRKFRVRDILAAADDYQTRTGRIVNIEYCLLSGVNDSDAQAHLLADLLANRRMHVNLIPYNAIGPGLSGRHYQQPPPQRMQQFARILGQHNVVAHFRQTRGQDIDGACGQLRQRANSPAGPAGSSL